MSEDSGRPHDDLMGGWDIETTQWPPRNESRWQLHVTNKPEPMSRSEALQLLEGLPEISNLFPPQTQKKAIIAQEFLRDLLTNEEYFFVSEIDNGYALGKDVAGEYVLLGLQNWEKFTR